MKKRNPTDSTERNVKAGNKKDAKQDAKVKELERRIKQIEDALHEHLGVDLK